MTSVFLGTPTTREFSAAYVSSLWLTRFNGEVSWKVIQGQPIDIGRNAIVKNFLATRHDYLLMHDSDATWNPEAVQRLVDRALPVVTGIIFKRGFPTVPTIGIDTGPSVSGGGTRLYSFADTIKKIYAVAERERITLETKNELLFEKRPGDLQEIDGCGAHFCCIRRDVLEKIKEPWYECSMIGGGEDFDFCRKVKAAGFKLYADFSVFTGHVMGPGVEIGVREFLMTASDRSAEIVTGWIA